MRYVLFFVGVIILWGCHEPAKDYPVPGKQEIQDVITAVITQQTIVDRWDTTGMRLNGLPGVAQFNSLDSLPLLVDLIKVKVDKSEDYTFNHVFFSTLVNDTLPGHFNKADSNYFNFQNGILPHFKIDQLKIPRTIYISKLQQNETKKRGARSVPFYEVSMPIFSLNQQQAYVHINVYLGFGQGGGYSFFLKKINAKWKIVKEWETWIA